MEAMQIKDKKDAQRGGHGGYGCNAPIAYAMGHGDPLWRRTGNIGEEMPTLSEMQKTYPTISKKKYDELMKSKPFLPRHNLKPKGGDYKPTQPLGGPFNEKVKDGLDLAEQERTNRYKYGVKKPANKWFHEMDDSRVTGD